MWIDNAFPKLLGAELYRPHPAYIMKLAIEPQVVWDSTKQRGEVIQLDRYKFWGEPGTKNSRRRDSTQVIGTSNGKAIPKDSVNMTIEEFTGPAASDNPNNPATFKIPLATLLHAQRMLYDTANVNTFHESIGSITLLDDYRRWYDGILCEELLNSPHSYNPRGVEDGGTYADVADAKFSVKEDLLTVVEELRRRNVPTYPDGNYRCVCGHRFYKHLRQDPDFREIARYPSFNPQMPAPNQMIFGGAQYAQSNDPGMQPVMPSGLVFEGVRFFESGNIPKQMIDMTFTESSDRLNPAGTAEREADLGIFFGPQAVGEAIGGRIAGPEVLLNSNDDFQRFIIAIWRVFGQYTLLNDEFVTVARTFGS